MSNKVLCSWCGKDTINTYQLEDNKYLCIECAKNHYHTVANEVNKQINYLQKIVSERQNALKQLIFESCDHSDFVRTGYCTKNESGMKEVCVCNICGNTLYKEPFI